MKTVFYGSTGSEIPAVTEDEMRAVDRVAIEETGPNLFQMMENAGRSLALTAIEMISDLQQARVVVLAGTGGNGGGGIAAARHLANRGIDVSVAVTDQATLGEVPAFQLHVYGHTKGALIYADDLEGTSPSLVVDAVIGYSLRGAPLGTAEAMIKWANAQSVAVLSLDVPSGINATSGHAPGTYVAPDTTLALALPKTGLANEKAGDLLLADLGIPEKTYSKAGVPIRADPFGGRFRVPVSRSQPPAAS